MNFNERNPLSVSSLTRAVELNAVNDLRRLIALKKGRNLNITDNRGWTALHVAAALGYLECIMILLKAGARIDVLTHQGETALFLACKYNRMEVVEKLIEWDKEDYLVNCSNNESFTPLHIACAERNLPLAQLLVENNANINAEDNCGVTPLQEAVMKIDLDMCKYLLEKGANINSREYDGHLAFHFACNTRNVELLRLLASHYKNDLESVINSGNCFGFTPIMLAVQSRSIENIEELLKLGADVNMLSRDDTLPLHLAVHSGDLAVMKRILETTSVDTINKYCSISKEVLQSKFDSEDDSFRSQRSLVSLIIDSESIECLQYIFNCGLNDSILNCPIIETSDLSSVCTFIQDMNNYASFGPHRNIEVEVNVSDLGMEVTSNRSKAIIVDPISFLLKYKMDDLKEDTIKYLEVMLENGLIFRCADYKYHNSVLLIHPYEAMMFTYQTEPQMLKDIVIKCVRLMISFGVSVDYICNVDEPTPIPALFVYACRLPLLEIIPDLLQNSSLIDLDDLLRWVVHKIFMRIDPPPHSIEKSLLDTYKYLTKYTSKSILSFQNDIKRPEYESRFNSVISYIDSDCVSSVPTLQIICRSVLRSAVKRSCLPHQLAVKLKSLQLPSSLIDFLNYNDMKKSFSDR